MEFPIIKLLLVVAIAFIVGVAAGWLMRGRNNAAGSQSGYSPDDVEKARLATQLRELRVRCDRCESELAALRSSPAPVESTASQAADDLKRISGVGPTLERTLNQLGITRFEQIAAWSEADVARVNDELRFSGRIERDDWIGQAKSFLAGR